MEHDARWRLKAAIAFATIYLVWGSTYLAIRIGVQALPPALFAGLRFVIAGLLLAGYARLRGQAFPDSRREWLTHAVVGLALVAGGNGLVVWGEQWVASNIAALIVASVALWIALLGTLGSQGEPLSRATVLGLALGFIGVVLLLAPHGARFAGGELAGQLAIALASLSWAAGTIYGRRRKPRTPTLMAAAMQMLIGGAALTAVGLIGGETARWSWDPAGVLALAYLIVFGSCLAFAAYAWLMHEVTPAQLGTYAYINPAIAVLLGAWLLNETLDGRQLLGMSVILAGVVVVTNAARRRARAAAPETAI